MRPIVIMGPTASGKTELALAAARQCGGEIISADSRQVYRNLLAGTAKPDGRWNTVNGRSLYIVEGVPYHLVDIADPKTSFDAAGFVNLARKAEAEITAAGHVPVFAGGTGMYVQAYWNGLDPLPQADPKIRRELESFAGQYGRPALHERLRLVDEASARTIPVNNIQRVIRALEVHELTGKPISSLWTHRYYDALPVHKAQFVLLDWAKPLLHERIQLRTAAILDAMARETQTLLDSGCPEDAPALKSLGYPQIIDYLQDRADKAETLHRIVSVTKAYAKRQMTWFRRYKNVRVMHIDSARDWEPARLAETLLQPVQK